MCALAYKLREIKKKKLLNFVESSLRIHRWPSHIRNHINFQITCHLHSTACLNLSGALKCLPMQCFLLSSSSTLKGI